MRRDLALLEDILSACDELIAMIRNKDLDAVAQDKQLQYAILHAYTIIGEASSRLTEELRDRYQHMPWNQVRGLRNRVIHEYFGLDWNLLWKTATEDIPAFREGIGAIIEAEDLRTDKDAG